MKTLNKVIVLGVIAITILLLLYFGIGYMNKQFSDRDERLIELYLKHSSKNKIDTFVVNNYYSPPKIDIKNEAKPIVVKEYLKDSLARANLERSSDLIIGQKFKLNLVGGIRRFSVATIDTSGMVRERFFKVPILTKQITFDPTGKVEFKKRKLIALKIAAGITAGFFTYSYLHKK